MLALALVAASVLLLPLGLLLGALLHRALRAHARVALVALATLAYAGAAAWMLLASRGPAWAMASGEEMAFWHLAFALALTMVIAWRRGASLEPVRSSS